MDADRNRVVLIHRDPDRARELAEDLRAAGMEVATAGDTAAGLTRAARGADVLVLDVDVEGKGARTCRDVRGDERAAGIPLLALSERVLDDQVTAEVLAAGASDVIVAPYSLPVLRARVENLARIRREEDFLAETEKRYQRIFSTTHYGYFLSSPEGRFLEINDAMVRILGYGSREEVLRLRLPQDLYVHPEDRQVFMRLIEKQGFVRDFKVHFKRKDGSAVTLLLTASRYRSPDGKTVRYEGVNIPLLEVEPSRSQRILDFLLGPLRRLLPEKRPRAMSVTRVTELVADRYERTEELSESHYSSVWKGRDMLLFEEAPLVVKVARSEAVNPRLLLEAKLLRKLAGHPSVPQLLDVTRHKGRVTLVTRFVEGRPLSQLMDGLSPVERDRVAFQLLDVVAHLHDHDVAHRDLKPENIVMGPDGRCTLLDYGISRALGEAETSATVIGTWPYMSPEQINGKSERRSDVWALGVVLYRLYTGRLPFEGATEMELMENILNKEPPVIRSVRSGLPAALEVILIQALRKKPEGRFHDAGEMRDTILSQVPGFRENVKDLIREIEPWQALVP